MECTTRPGPTFLWVDTNSDTDGAEDIHLFRQYHNIINNRDRTSKRRLHVWNPQFGNVNFGCLKTDKSCVNCGHDNSRHKILQEKTIECPSLVDLCGNKNSKADSTYRFHCLRSNWAVWMCISKIRIVTPSVTPPPTRYSVSGQRLSYWNFTKHLHSLKQKSSHFLKINKVFWVQTREQLWLSTFHSCGDKYIGRQSEICTFRVTGYS